MVKRIVDYGRRAVSCNWRTVSALATGVVAAKGGIAMRRIGLIVALGTLLGMLGGVATGSPALADGRGDGWQVVPAGHLDLPGYCTFTVATMPG